MRIHWGLLTQVDVSPEEGARCASCAGFVGIIIWVNKELEEKPSRSEALQRQGQQGAGVTPLKWWLSGWVILMDSLEVIIPSLWNPISPMKPLPGKHCIILVDRWSWIIDTNIKLIQCMNNNDTIPKRAKRESKWICKVYCFTLSFYTKLSFPFSPIDFPSWVLNNLSPMDQPMLDILYGSVRNFKVKSPVLTFLWAARIVFSLIQQMIFIERLLWVRQCFGHWRNINEQTRKKPQLSWSLLSKGKEKKKPQNKTRNQPEQTFRKLD